MQNATNEALLTELPAEPEQELKTVSQKLMDRIKQLAIRLNNNAVRAAERRTAEVTRTTDEQTAQAETELAQATQTTDELTLRLDELQAEHATTITALNSAKKYSATRLLTGTVTGAAGGETKTTE